MVVDLLHNKIIAATVSDAFLKSFKENALPKLSEKYGDSITLVQMYEDHIADGFLLGGEFYYPLTVVTDRINTQWIKWKVVKGKFDGASPYALRDGELNFVLTDDVPGEFSDKLVGRARFFEGGLVKLRVETTLSDVSLLSGKYSQTFIDEMARQLTPAIETATSVEGLASSNIELCLVFAPDSYMEHTSENVTYRRLLITDNSGSPRDFWIKWTRLDGATAYSVAANPDSSDILFEIGEDVNQKIREKEYRFLLSAMGKDKYHNAMGRKNVTEWREIIKRAIRRGELTKIEPVEIVSEENDELMSELMSLLGTNAPAAADSEVVASRESDEELAKALEFARLAIEAENMENSADEEEEDEERDELDEFYSEALESPLEVRFDEEEEKEIDDLARLAKEELVGVNSTEVSFEDAESSEEFSEQEGGEESEAGELYAEEEEAEKEELIVVPEEPCAEEYSEIEDEDSLEDAENEEALLELRALEGVQTAEEDPKPSDNAEQEKTPANQAPVITAEELEEKIRAEIEAKLRLEYERDARRKAEEEAERLRRENEKLLLAAKEEEARRMEREKERLEETEKLKIQIEAQLRAEARERERLADAARAAVEEQRRLEEEKARIERIRIEEQRRLEAEERARALEEERAKEVERIRRETEAKVRAEYEESLSDADVYVPSPEKTSEKDTRTDYVNPNYTYVSKNVKLLFRRSVDPNVTGRIHEIIKATLDYYGKSKVYLKIKATVPDTETVILEFVKIPMEEMELLGNIIKVLGNSGLGIAKAIVD